MSTLYALADSYREVLHEIALNGGELTPEIEERLDHAEGDLEEKAERIVHVIRQLQLDANAAKEESKRLADLAKSRENAAERLTEYLRIQMAVTGLERIDRPTAVITRYPGAYRCEVGEVDVLTLPEGFRRHTPERWDVDKKAVIEAAKGGESLPNGLTVVRGETLRIR